MAMMRQSLMGFANSWLVKPLSFIFESPVLLSWSTLGLRFFSLILVWPMVLRGFSPAETAVWALIATLLSIQPLLESAFADTFSRAVAHAKGGRTDFSYRGLFRSTVTSEGVRSSQPNWDAVGRMRALMLWLYSGLALFFLVIALIVGIIVMGKPIEHLTGAGQQSSAWAAVLIALAGSAISLFCNQYVALANGLHLLKELKRIEFLIATGSLLTSWFVLLGGGRILSLVLASQSWILIGAFASFLLIRKDSSPIPNTSKFDWTLYKALWPGLWRSWLGIAVSAGAIQAMPLIYSQESDPKLLAEFLFSFRIINFLVALSLPPFYTKLTRIASMLAAGDEQGAVVLSQNRMFWSLMSFAVAFVVIGSISPLLLRTWGSQIGFVAFDVWFYLGLGFFLERMAGMHNQLFSQTGVINWHIGNSIYGGLILGIAFALYPFLDVRAFGVAIIAANCLFFLPFSMRQSYRRFSLGWSFESRAALFPLLIMLAFGAVNFFILLGF